MKVFSLLVWTTFAATACSSRSEPRAALPSAPPIVTVVMTDFSLAYMPRVPAGRVVFHARNVGKVRHNLVLLPLPDDLPPFDEQLRGKERRIADPFGALRPVRPGESREFAIDLEPGRRYGIFCSVVDAEGKSHAVKGMNSEFRAAPSPEQRAKPLASRG